jgi:hypothetical protein
LLEGDPTAEVSGYRCRFHAVLQSFWASSRKYLECQLTSGGWILTVGGPGWITFHFRSKWKEWQVEVPGDRRYIEVAMPNGRATIYAVEDPELFRQVMGTLADDICQAEFHLPAKELPAGTGADLYPGLTLARDLALGKQE